jgi:PAS domain S-box-containing protein
VLAAGIRPPAAGNAEAWLAAIVSSSTDAVIGKSLDGIIQSWNAGAARLFGYTAGEAIGRSILILVPLDLHDEEAMIMARLTRGEHIDSYETVGLRKNSSRVHVSLSVSPIRNAAGRVVGVAKIARDITDARRLYSAERELLVRADEREAALASLETERSRLAMIFEHAPAFLAVMRGPDYVFERINPAYLTLVGHRDPIGLALAEALPEIRGQGFIELLDAVRETGEPFVGRQMPVQLTRTPGAAPETRYVDQVYQRLMDPDGQIRVAAHGVDVTDQVHATNALRRTEQRLRDQFAKLPVPTFLWEARDDDFVLVDLNEAARALVEPSRDSWMGRTAADLFPQGWPIRDDVLRCLREEVVVRRSVTHDSGHEAQRRTFDVTIGPQQPNRVVVHAAETTDQTRLANELRQAQRMEAVGQLAGGVAHDFNNLLTVIGAHSAFLLDGLGATNELAAHAHAIQEASGRAAALTRQLLAFGRKQILTPAVVDLNVVVADMERMLGRILVGDSIEIIQTLTPDVASVLVDVGQIEQVLMNFILNARDAMPSGGQVNIVTRRVEVPASSRLTGALVPPGSYIALSVADSGGGMDAETRARAFEPFFTTKEAGKGSGMGLSTVHGIVSQSGGYVTVESALGAGATFTVYFPVAQDDVAPVVQVRAVQPVPSQAETVLLVEDNPAVRQIAKRVLLHEGYRVLEACDGAVALALSAAYDGSIDIVITDAVMPGMSGVAVLNQIRLDRPSAKAVLMSGYTDDEVTRRGITSTNTNVSFVQKPFTPVDFARRVRLALDS